MSLIIIGNIALSMRPARSFALVLKQLLDLRAVLKRDFSPLSPTEKLLSVLRSHFWTKMFDIFRKYYLMYEESNAAFRFCLNVLE